MADESLLEEIRENRTRADAAFHDIRKEGATDIQYVAGKVWTDADKEQRGNRPMVSLDELGQYVNQLINEVRLNKRAIKVTSVSVDLGSRAEKLAEARANLIRQIEYRSNAPQQAYTTMFESAVQRSYGWLRVMPEFVSDDSLDQELRIVEVPNPSAVVPDPDHVMADGADLGFLYCDDWHSEGEFERRWPEAEYKPSSKVAMEVAPTWVDGKRTRVSEYWTKETTRRRLIVIASDTGVQKHWADDLKKKGVDIKEFLKGVENFRDRVVDVVQVKQYVTNGVEILERADWPGKSLPWVPCYGKVLFVEDGGTIKREILSLVRLARDPFKLYCWAWSAAMEVAGFSPRIPWFARKGSLSAVAKQALEESPFRPAGVIEVEATDPGNPTAPPPEFPVRPDYRLFISEYLALIEAARRAVQAAMGTSPLPTSAQRRNEKSGKALQQIEEAGQKGSFHFVDHYEAAIRRTGEILNELIPHYYDTARQLTVRKPDDTTESLMVNDPANEDAVDLTIGEFDVTIGTGPSFDSEREAAQELGRLLLESDMAPQIADLAIKLMQPGPMGEAIADRLTPPAFRQAKDGKPDPVMMQQQIAQAQQAIDALTTQLESMAETIKTDAIKGQVQLAIAKMNNAARIRIAETSARLKGLELQLGQAFEAEQAEIEREFNAEMAAAQHQADVSMARIGHQQTMQQGAQQHQQALDAAAQQAALQPPPEAGA